MKTNSISDMIRSLNMLRETKQLTRTDRELVELLSEISNGGADTPKLSNAQVDDVDRLYRENFV